MNLRRPDTAGKVFAVTAATARLASMAPACSSDDPADDSVKDEFIRKPQYSG